MVLVTRDAECLGYKGGQSSVEAGEAVYWSAVSVACWSMLHPGSAVARGYHLGAEGTGG